MLEKTSWKPLFVEDDHKHLEVGAVLPVCTDLPIWKENSEVSAKLKKIACRALLIYLFIFSDLFYYHEYVHIEIFIFLTIIGVRITTQVYCSDGHMQR